MVEIPVDVNEIAGLMGRVFEGEVTSLAFIGSGMFSQAYSFQAGQGAYIIRFNDFEEDFKKDSYARSNYASPRLPIPKVLHVGPLEGRAYFAITERCPGITLDRLEADVIRQITPELFSTLEAIHDVDVSKGHGWGLTNSRGEGLFSSWENHLLSFYNQKFAFEWPQLIAETLLERAVYEEFYERIMRLLSYTASPKSLVHGDFGFDNVVSDGQRITGVLDWAESMLGDFLYDVAYLDFWSKEIPYGDLWFGHAQDQAMEVPSFAERMECYMLHIGLGSLAIAAITNDCCGYMRTKERMRSVLAPGRRRESDWTQ